MAPPVAEIRHHELKASGGQRIDPYFWLRERESESVIAYLDAENAFTETTLAPTSDLQETLYREIRGRIREADSTAPYRDGDYWYFVRYRDGEEYPEYLRRPHDSDRESVILDVNELAKGHEFFSVRGLSLSPDHQRLAFFVDDVGRRQYRLYIKCLVSGVVQETTYRGLAPGAEWSADGRYVFFICNDETTLRARYVCRLDTATDSLITMFDERDEAFSVYLDKTRSEAFITITTVSTVATEVHLLPSDRVDANLVCCRPRQRDHEYFVDHDATGFYIVSNDAAKNFWLLRLDEIDADWASASTVLAHSDDALLEDVTLFEQFIVAEYMQNGLRRLHVLERGSGHSHDVAFHDPAYAVSVGDNCLYATSVLRFDYESMTTPASVFDYDMHTRTRALVKQDEVLGDFRSDDYVSERLMVTARDGTAIPVSLIRKVGSTQPAPLLLYAYGAYGYSIEPTFSYSRISLLDRGFAFAIAHIRGGSDLGREWYESGRQKRKWNTFNDFVDVGVGLIEKGYADKTRLYAMGGSAGGLLMGVVANVAPQLFAGIVAAVPFVDVVTTMLDSDIPLTTGEFDEWGNPENQDDYDYMLSYSPYDNVSNQCYPPMLITAGLHDSQVQYWEPAKWVAKLRAQPANQSLMLLHTNMGAGHGGPSGRFNALRETAMEYAFLLMLDAQHDGP